MAYKLHPVGGEFLELAIDGTDKPAVFWNEVADRFAIEVLPRHPKVGDTIAIGCKAGLWKVEVVFDEWVIASHVAGTAPPKTTAALFENCVVQS